MNTRITQLLVVAGACMCSSGIALGQVDIRLIALPTPSAGDVTATLPTSQVGFPVNSAFVVEMWAQTTDPNGFAQVTADITFDPTLVSVGTVTHTALFNLFTSGSVNNVLGTINNLSGSHPPAIPACSDAVGATPNWARVATINMTANAVGALTIQAADANDLIFVIANCGSAAAPITTFAGAAMAVTLCGNSITEPGEQCDDGNVLAFDCCSPTCQFEATTTQCRAAVGECDAAEFCDGAGACPVDGFQPVGAACGNPANTVCDNPDTCDGAGACLANPEPLTTVCRVAASACDVAESCDGAGNCPADAFQPVGTACGDPTGTVCNNPDSCDGAGACLTNFEPIATVCRVAASECDASEFCDGAGGCPVDSFQPVGTACGDPSNTVCDNPDSCDGTGGCQANLEPATTVCRAAAGDCDVPESCDGLGRCPIDTFKPLGTACGSPANTVCDNPDTCNATGTCLANSEPTTLLCRPSAGECDVGEFCDGVGACPADAFQPTGTACGDPTGTVCNNPDSCDGAGACQNNLEPTTTVCRAAAGACDVAESCDGAGACPVDSFQLAGTACGDPTATVCNNPDTCDGAGACQSNLEPTTTVCRAAAGECDVAESCDGAGACPVDSFQLAGTACGDPTATVCNNSDSCDGSGVCQSNFEPGTTVCRPSAGECDVAESCDGAGACPVDSFQLAGTACGDPTATLCNNPDTCDGAGACQVNFEPITTICRGALGVCDLTEFCDGAGLCPVDAKDVSECRPAAGACDVAESCDGVNNDCPLDTFQPLGTACGDIANTTCDNPDTCDGAGTCQSNFEPTATVCRPAAGECDVTEFCDGLGRCPNDFFVPVNTPCGSPASGVCDNPDTCDGVGACQPNFEPGTTVCRVSAGECDVAESCDGAGSCPADGFQLAGTACGDPTATVCNNPDTCDGAGACQNNLEPTTTVCRTAAGECDVAESCDGVGGCPADAFVLVGTACGDPTATVCNNADSCDGLGTCLSNFEPGTTLCRASAGECDVAEFCDGIGACPLDSFQLVGTACGDPTATVCNNADSCDGSGACLSNLEPTTTVCRPAVDQCDVAESCDGLGGCPANAFALVGAPCGDPTATVCNNADTCDGLGTCLANLEPTTTICRAAVGVCDLAELCDGAGFCPLDAKDVSECRPAAGECDVAEFCDGVANDCPIDAFQPGGTACGNPISTVCNNPDTCDGAGLCQANLVTDGTSCSDGLFCNGAEACLAGVCELGPAVCTDVCQHCDEAGASCNWCIFDHNLNGSMDGFDFSFFSGCFGVCVPPTDPCFAANYDGDPLGCVGGGDFGAFSGCFSLTCVTCTGCSGPPVPPSGGGLAAAVMPSSNASVQLVAVSSAQLEDESPVLPRALVSAAAGSRFDLEVWAALAQDGSEGLASVYVDVAYDPLLLEVEAVVPSASFSTFSHGEIESSAGLVSALGGCAPVGVAMLGTESTWVRVATLQMHVLAAGHVTVTASPSYGPYGVSLFGRFGDLPASRIEFGEADLELLRGYSPTLRRRVVRKRASR